MKKLLVLTLVLGMASLASANLTVLLDGEAAADGLIVVSDGSLDVAATAATATQGYDLTISVTGDLAIISAATSFPGANEFSAWYFGNGFLGAPDATKARLSGGAIQPVAIGTAAFDGLVITGTNGTISFDEIVDNGEHVVSSVTVVPEPGTLALLGLGVLALRRKK